MRNEDDDLDLGEDIESINNNIQFFSDISASSISTLIKQIKKTTNMLLDIQSKYNVTGLRIKLHINSYGGELLAGFAAMDIIIHNKIPIDTYTIGCSASAATFLSIVGKERYIYENSYMLVHQLSTVQVGNYNQLKDEMTNAEMFTKRMVDLYSKYSTMPDKIIKDILKHDLFIDSKKCLKYGLVDKIIKDK